MEVVLVSCALIFLDNKVLCGQRSPAMTLPGLWEFPGGKIEEDETAEECLVREIKEELAISIKLISSLKSRDYRLSGEKVIRLIPFVCIWTTGLLTLLEHSKVDWFEKDELRSLKWAPADIPIVEEVVTNWNDIQEQLVGFDRGN